MAWILFSISHDKTTLLPITPKNKVVFFSVHKQNSSRVESIFHRHIDNKMLQLAMSLLDIRFGLPELSKQINTFC